jgi:hypothetical protein
MLRYGGKSMEELGSILKEKNISLSILAPRKIPSLYNIFDKAGGDLLQVSHLVDLPASVGDPVPQDPHVFWASRIRIHSSDVRVRSRILPFSHKCVERTKMMRAK